MPPAARLSLGDLLGHSQGLGVFRPPGVSDQPFQGAEAAVAAPGADVDFARDHAVFPIDDAAGGLQSPRVAAAMLVIGEHRLEENPLFPGAGQPRLARPAGEGPRQRAAFLLPRQQGLEGDLQVEIDLQQPREHAVDFQRPGGGVETGIGQEARHPLLIAAGDIPSDPAPCECDRGVRLGFRDGVDRPAAAGPARFPAPPAAAATSASAAPRARAESPHVPATPALPRPNRTDKAA